MSPNAGPRPGYRNLNAKLALVEPFLATFAVKLVLFFHLILVYLVIYDSG